MEVADRVVVMNEGRIEQVGTPDEVYDHPASPFVLQFLGDVNLFHGRLGHAPGGVAPDDVSYVRPHELDLVAEPDERLVRGAAVAGADPGAADAARVPARRRQLSSTSSCRARAGCNCATRCALSPGAHAHLRPRRVTRFVVGGEAAVEHDPAAMI